MDLEPMTTDEQLAAVAPIVSFARDNGFMVSVNEDHVTIEVPKFKVPTNSDEKKYGFRICVTEVKQAINQVKDKYR